MVLKNRNKDKNKKLSKNNLSLKNRDIRQNNRKNKVYHSKIIKIQKIQRRLTFLKAFNLKNSTKMR